VGEAVATNGGQTGEADLAEEGKGTVVEHPNSMPLQPGSAFTDVADRYHSVARF